MNIIIITGQTATGKTQLALNYAKKYDGELINCDSRQVYKYLDIITGKDLTDNTFHKKYTLHHLTIGHYNLQTTHYQLPTIPIWLYDIVDPKDNFSSFDFQLCAIEVLKDIISRGKTPIIVGGTYFYLKHLLYHNQGENIMPNWQLRGDLENKSVEELQHLLQQYDQELFDEMNDSDRQNPRRLMRKIEMAMAGEEPEHISYDHMKLAEKLEVDSVDVEFIGLRLEDREELRKQVKVRVEKRLEQGAIEEVEKLLHQGYTKVDPGLQTIGYQQVIAYLEKEITRDAMIEQWVNKEMQYSKRQYTFMKKDPNIKWM